MNLTRGINLRKVAEKMTGASGAESKVNLLLEIFLVQRVGIKGEPVIILVIF